VSELNEKDMRVLGHYASEGNRERYWNYLAQHEGSDGYGLLALGVVRNDNMPGAVANAYAQSYAHQHDGVDMSERQWEMFGRRLVEEDFKIREQHFQNGERSQALNLRGGEVQAAHQVSFRADRVDPDAWTPNRLIEAARRTGGEEEVDKVWATMLDNSLGGSKRMAETTRGIVSDYRAELTGWKGYMASLSMAEMAAAKSSPTSDPDHIQRGIEHYEFDRRDKSWSVYADSDVAEFGFRTPSSPVQDKATIESLNDARAVRIEREALSQKVHPDDPHRALARSPHTIADAGSHGAAQEQIAADGRSINPGLYDDLRQRLPEGTSQDRLAQITLAAHQADIRGGEVAGLSIHNDTTLQVHGTRAGDRALVDLSAPPPTVEQTIQQAHAHGQAQAIEATNFNQQQANVEQVAQQQAQQQQQQAMTQSGPTMGGRGMA
jgi:hypothetical protein